MNPLNPIKIGFDLDNTLVDYNQLFYQIGLEHQLIHPATPPIKSIIKESIIQNHSNDVWTELQGVVYGSEMHRATFYEGVDQFLVELKQQGFQYVIISHRSKYPYRGDKIDLHQSATEWLSANFVKLDKDFDLKKDLFLNETLEEKVACIQKCCCDYFIDDLVTVLTATGFPESTYKLHFKPNIPNMHNLSNPVSVDSINVIKDKLIDIRINQSQSDVIQFGSWKAFAHAFFMVLAAA